MMRFLTCAWVFVCLGSGHATTIQPLVEAAKPGDTVQVPAGIYREAVTLSAPITLVGDPGCEIRGSDVWTQWAPDGKVWKSSLTVPDFYHYGYGDQQSKWPEPVFINDKALPLDAFKQSPGAKGNPYITQEQAQVLLKGANVPLQPGN